MSVQTIIRHELPVSRELPVCWLSGSGYQNLGADNVSVIDSSMETLFHGAVVNDDEINPSDRLDPVAPAIRFIRNAFVCPPVIVPSFKLLVVSEVRDQLVAAGVRCRPAICDGIFRLPFGRLEEELPSKARRLLRSSKDNLYPNEALLDAYRVEGTVEYWEACAAWHDPDGPYPIDCRAEITAPGTSIRREIVETSRAFVHKHKVAIASGRACTPEVFAILRPHLTEGYFVTAENI